MPKFITTTVAANVRPIGSEGKYERRTFEVEIDADFEASDISRLTDASRQIEKQGLEFRDIEFLEDLDSLKS